MVTFSGNSCAIIEKLAVRKHELPTASIDLMTKLRPMKVVPSSMLSRRPKRIEQRPVKKIPVLKTLKMVKKLQQKEAKFLKYHKTTSQKENLRTPC